MEFGGPGLENLSIESRMVIPNTMAEIGVKNAYLPPDHAVFDTLRRKSKIPREQLEAQALYPDEDARYAAVYDVVLDRLEPLIACPHSVDNVRPLSAIAGQPIDMAFIGTCTNGRLEDLQAAAGGLARPAHSPTDKVIGDPRFERDIFHGTQARDHRDFG